MQSSICEKLIKPRKFDIVEEKEGSLWLGKVIAEPLERGFGNTLGNALRRILLSSLRGPAVTSIKLDGAMHQFCDIAGIREDVVEIILNIKRLVFSTSSFSEKERLVLKTDKAGPVTAKDIQLPEGVQVMNPDHVILNLDSGGSINMEMILEVKSGYVPAEQNEVQDSIGSIALDSFHSPIKRVGYKVERSKSARFIEYDRLILEVLTNGSIKPKEAVELAATILKDQFSSFITFEETVVEEDSPESKLGFNPMLLKRVEEVLSLSVRASNCLQCCNIVYLGDLVHKTRDELLSTPNFGRKSLDELSEQLKLVNLELGMEVNNWPPRNIDELTKTYLRKEEI